MQSFWPIVPAFNVLYNTNVNIMHSYTTCLIFLNHAFYFEIFLARVLVEHKNPFLLKNNTLFYWKTHVKAKGNILKKMYIVFFLPQIVKVMKPVVEASSHVLGNKTVDEGKICFSVAFPPENKLLWFYTI